MYYQEPHQRGSRQHDDKGESHCEHSKPVADRFVSPSRSAALDCKHTASEGPVEAVSQECGNGRTEDEYEEITRHSCSSYLQKLHLSHLLQRPAPGHAIKLGHYRTSARQRENMKRSAQKRNRRTPRQVLRESGGCSLSQPRVRFGLMSERCGG
jgi:hypothetical protein